MRSSFVLAAGALVLVSSVVVTTAAQGPAPAPAAPAGNAPAGAQQAPARGRGVIAPPAGRGGPATFPAQQRPPGDPVLIARGKGLYDVNCRLCHGADLRGGDMGGVNLLRSQLVFNDQKGELIKPVVQGGRSNPGMPAMPPFQIPDTDVAALAEYLHSVQATMRGQGNPPPGEQPVVLNIVVGNATAGQAYFQAKCSSCHSATGDLKGLATRISDPMALQTAWVAGGQGGGRGGRGGADAAPAAAPKPTMVTVTMANGQKVEGPLVRYDDFIVVLKNADGTERSIRRNGDVPKVEVKAPREPHIKLLPTYTDKDIHDVTAYLVTLK